jgi:hypothetical protein
MDGNIRWFSFKAGTYQHDSGGGNRILSEVQFIRPKAHAADVDQVIIKGIGAMPQHLIRQLILLGNTLDTIVLHQYNDSKSQAKYKKNIWCQVRNVPTKQHRKHEYGCNVSG